MPCPSTGPKMFWAGPNFFFLTKICFTYCAGPKLFVPDQKIIFIYALSFYSLLPCPFTGLKMFWAGPNFLCQTKNLFTYCASHKHFVPDKKMICIQ